MIVHWTRQAVDDRASIFDYLLDYNPTAALTIDEAFEHAAARLQDFPRSGKIGVISGTRELFHIQAIVLCMKSRRTRSSF